MDTGVACSSFRTLSEAVYNCPAQSGFWQSDVQFLVDGLNWATQDGDRNEAQDALLPLALDVATIWVRRQPTARIYLIPLIPRVLRVISIRVDNDKVVHHGMRLLLALAGPGWPQESLDEAQAMVLQVFTTYGMTPHHLIKSVLMPMQEAIQKMLAERDNMHGLD
jgi:hypothetical protein